MRIESKCLFLLLIVLLGNSKIRLNAQADFCGTQAYQSIISTIKKEGQSTLLSINKAGGIIEIPTIVHLILESPDQDISDETVANILDNLSSDFRRENEDAEETPAEFQSIAADTEIEFCLASQDPFGDPTTGITRTISNLANPNFVDIKYSQSGGKDAWPANKYLNIWVGPTPGSFLGYAQFPGGNSATDGLVIRREYFIDDPLSPAARILTHELGHWLNLKHIWGNGNCDFDDGVSDTPKANSSSSNLVCNVVDNSCIDEPIDWNDMNHNYMDYSNSCANLFTLGQKDRMHSTLSPSGLRSELSTSFACSFASLESLDIAASKIIIPPSLYCSENAVQLEFYNSGELSISSFNYELSINGLSIIDSIWNGTLEPYSYLIIEEELPSIDWLINENIFLELTASNPNNLEDEYPANDQIEINCFINPLPEDTPLWESFESQNLKDIGWSVYNPDRAVEWAVSNIAAVQGSNSVRLKAHNSILLIYEDRFGVGLRSPLITTESLDSLKMEFSWAHAWIEEEVNDSLLVKISTDCGASFNSIEVITGEEILSHVSVPIAEAFIPNHPSEWRSMELDLSTFIGQDFQIEFEYIARYGASDIFIDQVLFNGIPSIEVEDTTTMVSTPELLEEDEAKLHLWPNPCKAVINLRLRALEIDLEVDRPNRIYCFDATGRKYELNCEMEGEDLRINTASLPAGIYFLKIGNRALNSVFIVMN